MSLNEFICVLLRKAIQVALQNSLFLFFRTPAIADEAVNTTVTHEFQRIDSQLLEQMDINEAEGYH